MNHALHQICLKNAITQDEFPVYGGIPVSYDIYPYAPYVPNDWNKILVLAESQQLRRKNKGNILYAESLLAMDTLDQIFRLGNKKITGTTEGVKLGISPWDEGYIKLAMLSAFPQYTLDQYAVSNAVPWHLDKSKEKKAQADFLKDKSIVFWKMLLPVLKPNIVVCTGEIAKSIISRTGYCSNDGCRKVHIRSASQLHFVVKKTYDHIGWLEQNPSIKKMLSENMHLIPSDKPFRQFVFYVERAMEIINWNQYFDGLQN